jgi:hypothetical protein
VPGDRSRHDGQDIERRDPDIETVLHEGPGVQERSEELVHAIDLRDRKCHGLALARLILADLALSELKLPAHHRQGLAELVDHDGEEV